MTARITKIDPMKHGNGALYKRVYFETEKGAWAKTDLCPNMKNWSRWEALLQVDNLVGGLTMRDEKTIDADSNPTLLFKPPKQIELL